MQQQYVISDSNVIIDLEVAGLINELFQLPYTFAVPDILFHDELQEQHSYLPAMGLRQLSLNSETMMYAITLNSQYSKAGRYDLFALALAKQETCPLLTGDQALRKAAQAEKVTLRGTLWLIEGMVTHGIITVAQANAAYDKMEANQRRLPWKEARARLKRLKPA
ncbi:PIN domain-containing protein [Candidatus Sororendozoicomonas aggregata]|uniref:PIN domain-containing protein n=1 Tax=Candidatus Sororendozoicomonas aggregata TaxID=3073239 RepID=UPI002ED5C56C